MTDQYIILAAGWLVYGAIHSLLAAAGIKKWWSRQIGKYFIYYRLYYNVFALLALIALLRYQFSLPTLRLWRQQTLILVVGLLLLLSGLVLMSISIRKYFFDLSGLFKEETADTKPLLQTNDIHQYVRHPLYLGTFAFIWGTWLAYPLWTLTIMNACITLYTLVGIRLEEKKLLDLYGDQYRQYQRRVPMILPIGRRSSN